MATNEREPSVPGYRLNSYQHRTLAQSTQDLSAYTGLSIQLVFHAITDAQNDSDFFVGDVSAQAWDQSKK